MNKNYIAPETRTIAVAAAHMVCNSDITIDSTNTTTTQFSREGSSWEEDDYDF